VVTNVNRAPRSDAPDHGTVGIVLLQSTVLVKALEEAVEYDPGRHHNQPPLLVLKIDASGLYLDIRELIDELKKFNANLEASKWPSATERVNLKKHLNTFLEKYIGGLGTGASVLTIGLVGSLLAYLGAPDIVASLLKTIK